MSSKKWRPFCLGLNMCWMSIKYCPEGINQGVSLSLSLVFGVYTYRNIDVQTPSQLSQHYSGAITSNLAPVIVIYGKRFYKVSFS